MWWYKLSLGRIGIDLLNSPCRGWFRIDRWGFSVMWGGCVSWSGLGCGQQDTWSAVSHCVIGWSVLSLCAVFNYPWNLQSSGEQETTDRGSHLSWIHWLLLSVASEADLMVCCGAQQWFPISLSSLMVEEATNPYWLSGVSVTSTTSNEPLCCSVCAGCVVSLCWQLYQLQKAICVMSCVFTSTAANQCSKRNKVSFKEWAETCKTSYLVRSWRRAIPNRENNIIKCNFQCSDIAVNKGLESGDHWHY